MLWEEHRIHRRPNLNPCLDTNYSFDLEKLLSFSKPCYSHRKMRELNSKNSPAPPKPNFLEFQKFYGT